MSLERVQSIAILLELALLGWFFIENMRVSMKKRSEKRRLISLKLVVIACIAVCGLYVTDLFIAFTIFDLILALVWGFLAVVWSRHLKRVRSQIDLEKQLIMAEDELEKSLKEYYRSTNQLN